MLLIINNISIVVGNPIPINNNNSLPCAYFKLGHGKYNSPSLQVLVDSTSAMNSDNKPYHRIIMSQFPDAVVGYIEWEPNIKYGLVQSKVNVTQCTPEGKFNNGILSTIIRYKTQYLFNSQPLILNLFLGDTLTLCTILGTPSLEVIHRVLDMCDHTLLLKKLSITSSPVMTKSWPGLSSTSNLLLQSDSHPTPITSSDEMHTLVTGSTSKFLTYPSHLDDLAVTDSSENNIFSRSVTHHNDSSRF